MPTVNLQVAASADDADQTGTTCAIVGPYVRMYTSAGTWKVGWRFVPVTAIPRYSTGITATLSIKCTSTTYDTILGDVKGEEGGSPAAFTTDANDIGARTLTTAAVALDTTDGGTDWLTFDVSSIVTELVADYELSAIVLVAASDSGSSVGRIVAYDGDTANCAKLDITYTEPVTGQPARVRSFGIPTGAGRRDRPGGWN